MALTERGNEEGTIDAQVYVRYDDQREKGDFACRSSIKSWCDDGMAEDSHVACPASLVTFGCSVRK